MILTTEIVYDLLSDFQPLKRIYVIHNQYISQSYMLFEQMQQSNKTSWLIIRLQIGTECNLLPMGTSYVSAGNTITPYNKRISQNAIYHL